MHLRSTSLWCPYGHAVCRMLLGASVIIWPTRKPMPHTEIVQRLKTCVGFPTRSLYASVCVAECVCTSVAAWRIRSHFRYVRNKNIHTFRAGRRCACALKATTLHTGLWQREIHFRTHTFQYLTHTQQHAHTIAGILARHFPSIRVNAEHESWTPVGENWNDVCVCVTVAGNVEATRVDVWRGFAVGARPLVWSCGGTVWGS